MMGILIGSEYSDCRVQRWEDCDSDEGYGLEGDRAQWKLQQRVPPHQQGNHDQFWRDGNDAGIERNKNSEKAGRKHNTNNQNADHKKYGNNGRM